MDVAVSRRDCNDFFHFFLSFCSTMLGALKAMIFNPCAEEWRPLSPIEKPLECVQYQLIDSQASNSSSRTGRKISRNSMKDDVEGTDPNALSKTKTNRKAKPLHTGIYLFRADIYLFESRGLKSDPATTPATKNEEPSAFLVLLIFCLSVANSPSFWFCVQSGLNDSKRNACT